MPDYTNALLSGFQTGREMRRQEGLNNALADYATGKTQDVGEIARYDAGSALQLRKADEKRQQQLIADGTKAVGQAALLIAQKPEAERSMAWDQAIDGLAAQGWTSLAQYKGRYSPQALESVIASAGLSGDYIQGQQPKYLPIPAGGTLVNTRDPAAIAQFQGQVPMVSDQASYDAIPSGQQFRDPDGNLRVKP